MYSFAGTHKTVLLTMALIAGAGTALLPTLLTAQTELTADELEQYIAEQKAALEEVRENRDETERKAQEVRDLLAEQEAKQVVVEEELEALCKEQEELKPGSYDECKRTGSE